MVAICLGLNVLTFVVVSAATSLPWWPPRTTRWWWGPYRWQRSSWRNCQTSSVSTSGEKVWHIGRYRPLISDWSQEMLNCRCQALKSWFLHRQVISGLDIDYMDGLVQHCSNSSALAMELLQSCTKQSIWNGDLLVFPKSESKVCNILVLRNGIKLINIFVFTLKKNYWAY